MSFSISHIAELEDRFLNNPSHRIALGLLYILPHECPILEDGDSIPTEQDSIPTEQLTSRGDMPHAVVCAPH